MISKTIALIVGLMIGVTAAMAQNPSKPAYTQDKAPVMLNLSEDQLNQVFHQMWHVDVEGRKQLFHAMATGDKEAIKKVTGQLGQTTCDFLEVFRFVTGCRVGEYPPEEMLSGLFDDWLHTTLNSGSESPEAMVAALKGWCSHTMLADVDVVYTSDADDNQVVHRGKTVQKSWTVINPSKTTTLPDGLYLELLQQKPFGVLATATQPVPIPALKPGETAVLTVSMTIGANAPKGAWTGEWVTTCLVHNQRVYLRPQVRLLKQLAGKGKLPLNANFTIQ